MDIPKRDRPWFSGRRLSREAGDCFRSDGPGSIDRRPLGIHDQSSVIVAPALQLRLEEMEATCWERRGTQGNHPVSCLPITLWMVLSNLWMDVHTDRTCAIQAFIRVDLNRLAHIGPDFTSDAPCLVGHFHHFLEAVLPSINAVHLGQSEFGVRCTGICDLLWFNQRIIRWNDEWRRRGLW
jgi:hypothetical protein